MAVNALIKFETQAGGVAPGESVQLSHPGKDGWIEISDWSFDLEAEASHLKGTGASVGKPNAGPFSITHYYDKASPTIMQCIVKGMHFKTVTIDMTKQVGADKPAIFLQVIMKDVFIKKVSNKGGEDGNVSQDVEMAYKELGVCYHMQKNDGSMDSTDRMFRWNVATGDTENSGIKFNMAVK